MRLKRLKDASNELWCVQSYQIGSVTYNEIPFFTEDSVSTLPSTVTQSAELFKYTLHNNILY